MATGAQPATMRVGQWKMGYNLLHRGGRGPDDASPASPGPFGRGSRSDAGRLGTRAYGHREGLRLCELFSPPRWSCSEWWRSRGGWPATDEGSPKGRRKEMGLVTFHLQRLEHADGIKKACKARPEGGEKRRRGTVDSIVDTETVSQKCVCLQTRFFGEPLRSDASPHLRHSRAGRSSQLSGVTPWD